MIILALLVATLGTFLYGTLMGWIVHWIMHKKWSGFMYRSHMVHHIKKYPPWDMESGSYRSSGVNDAVFIFVPASFVAVLVLFIFFWFFQIPIWLYAVVGIESILLGLAHDIAHTGQHVPGHWTRKLGRLHRESIRLHHIHHRNMKRNIGILWFGWDRVFGTLKKR